MSIFDKGFGEVPETSLELDQSGMKIRITIYQNDSKGNERINECRIFDSKDEALYFIADLKAEPKPYKIMNNKLHFTYDSIC